MKHHSGQLLRHHNSNCPSLYSNLSSYSNFSSRSHSRFANYIKWLSNWRRAARISAFLLTLTIMAILFPISFKSADNLAEAASGTPKQSTLTYNATSSTASVSLSLNGTSASSGTFATSDNNQKAVFSLSTDNYTGYILRLKTTGATTLTNGTNTINAIESDGITSSSFGVNRWGLLPSKYNCITSTCPENTATYYQPTTTGFIMEQTSSANSTPKEYKVGMGLKADYNTPAGTYTSSAIVAEYVAREVGYEINYNKGRVDGTPSSMPSTQTDIISGTNVTLSSNTPTITGYTFTGWCLGTISTGNAGVDSCTGTTFSASGSFGIDQTVDNTVTLKAMWNTNTYTITLTNTSATTTGSTSATATYNSSTLTSITAPQRKYSFSGFTKTNSAYNATVSATTTKTYTYTFDGWYTASSGGTRIITAAGALVASTSYTDANGKWTSTSGVTLYAHWTAGTNQTLPTITQTDSTNGNGNCYWSSTNSTTGSQTYASGATISSPTAGATLYGVCKFPVKITFAGTGVSSVAVKSGSATGTTVGTVSSSGGSVSNLAYGTTYYLVPTYTNGYTLDNWKKTSAKGALAGTTTQNTTTTTANPTLTIGATSTTGSVGIMITGKSSCNTTAFSGYMQDMTTATVTNANVCDSGTLTDRRDSKTYTVKKLADGKLWMTENLAIDLTATSYDTLYGTGTNAGKMTNATSQALGYLKNGGGTSSDRWAMAGVSKNWTYASDSELSQPLIAVDSSTSGVCSSPSTWCVSSTGAWSWDTATPATINGKTSIVQGKIGVYYNYCAVSAGSHCWGDGEHNSYVSLSDPNASSLRDITSDICPYGWRLPTGPSSGEFNNLYSKYSGATEGQVKAFQTALSTPLSGYFNGGKAYFQGDSVHFLSSTWYNFAAMYALDVTFNGNNLMVTILSFSDGYGGSIRCVFDPPITPPVMQNTAVADLSEGEEKIVIDARDGNDYTIKKINGELWMTQNLRFTGTSLDSTTSNVASTYTTSSPYYVNGSSVKAYKSLKDDSACKGTSLTTDNSTNLCMQDSGSVSTGVWYNYAAATAGTITGTSNSTAAQYDICPKNWHLPTGPNTTANTDFNKLVGNTTSGYQEVVATVLTNFSAVAGGYYNNGSISSTDYGGWWSASVNGASARYLLGYNSNNGQFSGSSSRRRHLGSVVRCVRSS